ncbi:MAG: hypothetical protein M1831_001484 [Alyxoria varia]|nr:MAG: hypothetical protein M1831_001484 [Alyxoria varia]
MLTMQVLIKCLVLVSSFVNFIFASPSPDASTPAKSRDCIKPKVVIISLFDPEAEVWYGIKDFDLLAQNITIPGLSPLFPDVHCTKNEEICQVITGEAEINAATTITALSVSPRFDLTSTYFLVAGISGINPSVGTINDVTFARFAIQVALQYEFDSREIPRNFSTGYVPLGATDPEQYPQNIYGTEVFELNGELQKIAVDFAKKAKLNDSDIAQSYRSNYIQSAAKLGPSVHACDVATSDVYFSGDLLGEAFTNFTDLVTNGTALYCTTAQVCQLCVWGASMVKRKDIWRGAEQSMRSPQQEDNATLEALIRAAIYKLVDFSRIIVMRTASDFDRPFAGEPDTVNLFYADQGQNI